MRKYRGQDEVDAVKFLKLVKEKMKLVDMDESLINRTVNEGFSGGEKKRNEIFQMAVLDPKLAILDETDSGLDIDALRIVANGVNALRSHDRAIVVITHYQRLLEMDEKFLQRSVNEGFSGGEKKRNEVLQMLVLEPSLAVLDETDSGLDIDALRIVAGGVNKLRSTDNAFIVVTHYQRLLDYIVPDVVHVMADGRIIKSGPKELALELEEKGYDWVKEHA